MGVGFVRLLAMPVCAVLMTFAEPFATAGEASVPLINVRTFDGPCVTDELAQSIQRAAQDEITQGKHLPAGLTVIVGAKKEAHGLSRLEYFVLQGKVQIGTGSEEQRFTTQNSCAERQSSLVQSIITVLTLPTMEPPPEKPPPQAQTCPPVLAPAPCPTCARCPSPPPPRPPELSASASALIFLRVLPRPSFGVNGSIEAVLWRPLAVRLTGFGVFSSTTVAGKQLPIRVSGVELGLAYSFSPFPWLAPRVHVDVAAGTAAIDARDLSPGYAVTVPWFAATAGGELRVHVFRKISISGSVEALVPLTYPRADVQYLSQRAAEQRDILRPGAQLGLGVFAIFP